MKKLLVLGMALFMMFPALGSAAFAAEGEGYTIGASGEVEITSSQDLELHGEVEPTIISVTMPSYIPFSISKSLSSSNKVLSPRIDVTNHSPVPVEVFVDNTRIDLSQLGGTTWNENGTVRENQIAVGMVSSQQPPEDLSGAKWLAEGKQHLGLSSLAANEKDSLYLVGDLGKQVPDDRGFTVVATLVVSAR